MKTFKNNPQLKKDLLRELRKHRKADEIIQGVYWEDGKGCAVGCSIQSLKDIKHKDFDNADHSLYETELGLPEWLAQLEDRIFEGLPNGKARNFPIDLIAAIPVGIGKKQMDIVYHKFLYWLLIDKNDGVIKYSNAITDKAIRDIAELHNKAITKKVTEEEWESAGAVWSAEAAARSAARSAEAAAGAAAGAAVWSAVRSVEAAARSAARSADAAAGAVWSAVWSAEAAAGAAARADARSAEAAAGAAAYIKQAKKLISLLKEAK
jgi:hypothetical protein